MAVRSARLTRSRGLARGCHRPAAIERDMLKQAAMFISPNPEYSIRPVSRLQRLRLQRLRMEKLGKVRCGQRSHSVFLKATRPPFCQKDKGPGAIRGLSSRRYILPSKRMSILFAAFRSSHVIGAGTSVVLIRRCHRAAFLAPAASA
jgi:hypothetical protein